VQANVLEGKRFQVDGDRLVVRARVAGEVLSQVRALLALVLCW
jgi:hypothetical protein